MNEARVARTEQVQAWQRHYGMEPRNDSKLTELYATGALNWPADAVARELVATEFIFANTLYSELLEDFMRGVANALRMRHPRLSWTATWSIVRFYAPIALKLMSLDACSVRIPDRLAPPIVTTDGV